MRRGAGRGGAGRGGAWWGGAGWGGEGGGGAAYKGRGGVLGGGADPRWSPAQTPPERPCQRRRRREEGSAGVGFGPARLGLRPSWARNFFKINSTKEKS